MRKGAFSTVLYAMNDGIGLGIGLTKLTIVCDGRAMVRMKIPGNRQISSSGRYRG
jgi:hypothetical protein